MGTSLHKPRRQGELAGKLFIYYGCGDKHVGLATCSLGELVDHLLTCPA